MIVVSDTTAITSLLQIDRCDLLAKLYGEVVIPVAVRDELSANHPIMPGFLRVHSVQQPAEVLRLRAELDLGEAGAIVLARELAADLVLIDETEGRRVAAHEGLVVIGLLGVLVQAKQNGLLASVREVSSELESVAGFRATEANHLRGGRRVTMGPSVSG